MTNSSGKALLLYELVAREPGWRLTARCHPETLAKRARVGPRTQILSTMKKLFWMRISSTSARLSDMIALDNALKI